jgi:hypothetical protein
MTWQKWGSKQALEKRKASLSLMAVLVWLMIYVCRQPTIRLQLRK